MIIGGGFLFLILFIFSISINLFGLYGDIPSSDILENPKSEIASEIFSEDYKQIGKFYYYDRTPVEYSDLPSALVNALIATEDVRFYSHSGIDFKGTFAIFFYAITFQKRGSSTLSQQLAKNLFRMRDEKKLSGPLSGFMPVIKIKEMITAVMLERSYTKKEILTMYLNTVEFGNNTFGVDGASLRYFSKPVSKLKQEEAAMLVGLLKGPGVYDPVSKKERAFNRRNTVLSQMQKYGYLKEKVADSLKVIPLKLRITYESQNTGLAPHFRNHIKTFLNKWCYENGYNLYTDGLKIHTTINADMQEAANDAVQKHMKFLQAEFFKHWKGRKPWTDANHNEIKGLVEKYAKRTSRYQDLKKELGDNEKKILAEMKKPVRMRVFTWNGDKDTTMSPLDSIAYFLHFLHTGFVSIDPSNGHVKAWVGDINFRYFKYDHVDQGKRQPGSTFKPILYSYAIENFDLTPCSKVLDYPVTVTNEDGVTWTPHNSNNVYSNEYITLKEGLAKSVNTVSAYLMQKSGPKAVVEHAKRMGITSELEAVPTLALGTSDVSLLEIVNAYAVFVNNGFRYEPLTITRIEDKNGNVLAEFTQNKPTQVISPRTAYYMVELLKGSTEESGGTARRLKTMYHLDYPMGGKTGTTQGSSDGWFIGITPEVVSGAWVGGEDKSIRFRDMTYGQGAAMALPIFAYYMQKIYVNPDLRISKGDFPVPAGVEEMDECPGDSEEFHNNIPPEYP